MTVRSDNESPSHQKHRSRSLYGFGTKVTRRQESEYSCDSGKHELGVGGQSRGKGRKCSADLEE